MKKLPDYFETLMRRFFLGDAYWSQLRLLAILVSWFLWAALIGSLFHSSLDGLRYLILPVGIIVSVITLGARYIQDIYNLPSYSAAVRYICASFLGIGYPLIRIEHGRKEPDSDVHGLIESIGGPGYMDVLPGNAVLLERLQSPSGVCANGIYFIPRFNRIGAIVDLEEQQHSIKLMRASSKDGIPVSVQNVYYHYRLLSGANHTRSVSNPYPFSVPAVRNLAYNRTVTAKGLTDWEIAVRLAVDTAISDYINEHQIDQITAPSHLKTDPRQEIGLKIRSAGIKNRLKNIGTELTWFDVGSINAGADEVDAQRLKAWQAKWNEQSTVVRAEGEAQRIEFQEIGRVETQADLLKSILSSFRDVQVSDKHKENIRKIIMARTAQILDSMSSLYRNDDEDLVTGSRDFKRMNHTEKTSEARSGNHEREDVK